MEVKIAKNPNKKSKKKKNFNEDSLRGLCDITTHNIGIMGVPKGKERENKVGILFEKILTENFLNLTQEIDIKVQEALSSKQDEPKKDHTKTHHNLNGKG